jgi:hypothetical protein
VSRPPTDLPERLLETDATDFERRLLEAALRKGPPRATSARVAAALGVSVTAAAPVAAASTVAAGTAAKTTAAAATTVWPWISAGVLGLAVVGAVVATHRTSPAPSRAPAALAPSPPPAELPSVAPRAAAIALPVTASPRTRPATAADIADQIALLDRARAAMAAGAERRALETVRRYEDKYPSGTFRPEAAALKIEVLVKLGRTDEARLLAERFVAQHRGNLLARRVAELAGLGEPSAAP